MRGSSTKPRQKFQIKKYHDVNSPRNSLFPQLEGIIHEKFNNSQELNISHNFNNSFSEIEKPETPKKKAKKFDRLIEKLYENNAESVTILENETPTSENVEVDKDALATDTMTLISSYVDDVFSEDPEECKRLKEVFKELFLESFDL